VRKFDMALPNGDRETRVNRIFQQLASRLLVTSAGPRSKELSMPRGDKSRYTDKQKREAEHIEQGYERRGVPKDEAERRAWATVNKMHGGGEKPGGSGYGKPVNKEPARKGGRKGAKAAASRPKAARSASARKAARTRAARAGRRR
jgi:hypothetical protein